MHTSRKVIENSVRYLLKKFPAVVLLGARQVGKSTLLKKILPKAHFFDLEKASDRERVTEDCELLFNELKSPFIFDEAQHSPALFRALRVEIDRERKVNGRFLLSGSSSPELLRHITETLAGRIAIFEIPTFDWSECKKTEQSKLYLSLSNLKSVKNLKPLYSHGALLEFCIKGGYPDPFLNREDQTFFDIWYQNYIQNYVDRDIRTLFPNLKLDVYRKFIRMMCTATGEIINASNFARSLDVSQPTIKKYMDILEGTFLWRRLAPFEKKCKSRVVKMPRGHLRDSGLINYFLNIHTVEDLKSHHLYGRIWEGFVTEQILKGLDRNLVRYNYYFYRTSNQTEIDLILEGRFGLIPIEIKAGSSTSLRQLKGLSQFIKEQNCPCGIVVNNGSDIFMLSDKIIQIPAIFL